MEKKPFYISTSIPYVNAAPHIGHAVEFVQADILARYRRLLGEDVFFLSGTDDNALKNVLKAEEAGTPVREYIDEHAAIFKDLLSKLNCSNDDFIRTSVDKRHLDGAAKLWKSCKKEDIDKRVYKGLYCIGCEEFKHEKDLFENCCREHPSQPLEEIEEENYFFKLGNYTEELKKLIESDELRIVPETRKNEVNAFIRGGLQDLSISRSKERARGWGIPVPGDDTQVMYVWMDALSNYITALGYADEGDAYKKYWVNNDSKLHVIGKGISRFHAIYWPAFLLSAGVSLPNTIFVHGYMTADGQKMSKSIGNVIDPFHLIEEYGTDALRYYLLRHVHPFEDSDFTEEKFKEVYNANLANGLGNLAARIMKMSESYLDNPVDVSEPKPIPNVNKYTESCEFNRALDDIWFHIKETDELIQEQEPFKLVKTDKVAAQKQITHYVNDLNRISAQLKPYMPETAEKIQKVIKENKMPETLFPRKE